MNIVNDTTKMNVDALFTMISFIDSSRITKLMICAVIKFFDFILLCFN